MGVGFDRERDVEKKRRSLLITRISQAVPAPSSDTHPTPPPSGPGVDPQYYCYYCSRPSSHLLASRLACSWPSLSLPSPHPTYPPHTSTLSHLPRRDQNLEVVLQARFITRCTLLHLRLPSRVLEWREIERGLQRVRSLHQTSTARPRTTVVSRSFLCKFHFFSPSPSSSESQKRGGRRTDTGEHGAVIGACRSRLGVAFGRPELCICWLSGYPSDDTSQVATAAVTTALGPLPDLPALLKKAAGRGSGSTWNASSERALQYCCYFAVAFYSF